MSKKELKQLVADRAYWEELGANLGWRLYGWSFQSSATFDTPNQNNPRQPFQIQMLASQRDAIMQALNEARKAVKS